MSEAKVDVEILFNEIAVGETYPPNEKWHGYLLDQYKLYVEMADRISTRRATANTYFLSLNTANLAIVGYLAPKDIGQYLWMLAVAGLALSYLWRGLIRSYRDLNTAKWLVVHQIEKRLPISPYDAEWDAMGRGKNPELYRPISHIEMRVPLVFAVLHLFVLVTSFPYQAVARWITSVTTSFAV
jgi:hypothetical protein